MSDWSYVDRVDQCEHNFSFRITVAKTEELERMAMEFNQKPYALNAFPVMSEYKDTVKKDICIDNKNVVLVAMKKSVDKERYLFRLMNNSEKEVKAVLYVDGMELELSFGKYEVKTVAYKDTLAECKELEI